MLEALSMAGGPTEFANLNEVVIVRKNASGQLDSIRVRLAPVFKGGVNAAELARANIETIKTGDTVVVP